MLGWLCAKHPALLNGEPLLVAIDQLVASGKTRGISGVGDGIESNGRVILSNVQNSNTGQNQSSHCVHKVHKVAFFDSVRPITDHLVGLRGSCVDDLKEHIFRASTLELD